MSSVFIILMLSLLVACAETDGNDISGGDDGDYLFAFTIPSFDDAEELIVGIEDEVEAVLSNKSEFDMTVEMAFRISAAYEYDPENPKEDYDEEVSWGDGQFEIPAESSKKLSFSFSDFDFSSFEDGMLIQFLSLIYIYGDNGQKGRESGMDFFVEKNGDNLIMTHSNPYR